MNAISTNSSKPMISNPQKYDEGKLRFDLIDPFFEEELAEILTYGAKKYAPNNWQNLEDGINRHYAAAIRHLNKWRQGEINDPESGKPHLWHAATNLMFLCYHERNKEN